MNPTSLSADALTVRTDVAPLRKRFRFVLALHAVLVALCFGMIVWVSTNDLPLGIFVWSFLVILLGEIVQIGVQCYYWGGRMAITEPLTIDAWGLELHSQQGVIRLPWQAVTAVRLRRWMGTEVIAVGVHPQAVPGQYGVEGDAKAWPRLRKRGVFLGERGLQPGFAVILSAMQHYSQGRVPIG